MLSASLLAVALLVSSSGDEPTDDDEVRGSARGKAVEEVRGTSSPLFATPRHELDFLKQNKPSLFGAGSAVSAGGVVSVIGAVLTLVSFFAIRDEGQVFGILIGGAIFGVGALLGTIGGIVMTVLGAELTRVDARIRALETELGISLARF